MANCLPDNGGIFDLAGDGIECAAAALFDIVVVVVVVVVVVGSCIRSSFWMLIDNTQ